MAINVVLEIFRPTPTPSNTSKPHCFAGGVSDSGRLSSSADPIMIKTLAMMRTGNVLFRRRVAPPPIAHPAAPPAIMGSSSMPALRGPSRLTICARRGMLMMMSSSTKPERKVSL